MAGLALWTDRVLRRAGGREYVESLLEVSEITGRLTPKLKQVLLIFVRLLSREDSEVPITAREIVSPVAQLDAMLGMGSGDDTRLLTLLMQEELEGFPSTQR